MCPTAAQMWAAMREDAATLSLMQLCDGAFPAGLFAMSNGIEYMHRAGRMTSAGTLREFCSTYLANQVGPTDCVAAVMAHRYAEAGDMAGIEELDRAVLAAKQVRGPREASCRSGMQTVRCIKGLAGHRMLERYAGYVSGSGGGAHPVAVGVCGCALGMTSKMVSLAVPYGFVSGSVGAALRLGMLDHLEAQRTIHELQPDIIGAAECGRRSEALWQFCPQAEIMQMAHEEMDSKMFIT